MLKLSSCVSWGPLLSMTDDVFTMTEHNSVHKIEQFSREVMNTHTKEAGFPYRGHQTR